MAERVLAFRIDDELASNVELKVLAMAPVVDAELKPQQVGLRSCRKPRGRNGAVAVERSIDGPIESGGVDVQAPSTEELVKSRRPIRCYHDARPQPDTREIRGL